MELHSQILCYSLVATVRLIGRLHQFTVSIRFIGHCAETILQYVTILSSFKT